MTGTQNEPNKPEQQRINTGNSHADALRDNSLAMSGAGPIDFDKVVMADLDWEGATPVRGIGFRFLIPVPDLGSESKAHTVANWKGEEELVNGYKFRNLTDSADQAVVGDGTGVIIVAIDAEKTDGKATALKILAKIHELGGVNALNTEKLDQLLQYIRAELNVSDMYNSTDSIAESMVPQAGLYEPGDRPLGYYEKADKPGPEALFVGRPAEVLDGPHAGVARYPSGFMAVRIPPKKEGQDPSYRSIAPEAIGYCYVNADGSHIYFGDLPQR